MIQSFRHKGLERFYKTGIKAGIQPSHAPRHAIPVSGNWRLTFEIDGRDVHLVDYRGYH